MQVICLQSVKRNIKLAAVSCKSGRANDIIDSIQEVLNHYDAWSSIKIIITDTTAVNTGQQNGVVKKIQDIICSKGFCRPKYIGCQHHILDTILRHVLNFYLHNQSWSMIL